MQMDTKEREFFIGFVRFGLNDPCTIAVGTDSHEIEQFLIADMQIWQDEAYSLCEDKDHDQLFSAGEDELIDCDCAYALGIRFKYAKIDNDELADHLLDGETVVIDDDFEAEYQSFLEHYKDDLYGRD